MPACSFWLSFLVSDLQYPNKMYNKPIDFFVN